MQVSAERRGTLRVGDDSSVLDEIESVRGRPAQAHLALRGTQSESITDGVELPPTAMRAHLSHSISFDRS
jgi:hypothetical protein